MVIRRLFYFHVVQGDFLVTESSPSPHTFFFNEAGIKSDIVLECCVELHNLQRARIQCNLAIALEANKGASPVARQIGGLKQSPVANAHFQCLALHIKLEKQWLAGPVVGTV